MTRLILASLVLAISILPLYAQSSSLHTDRSGYTTGTDGNRTVNTYTDQTAIRPPNRGRAANWRAPTFTENEPNYEPDCERDCEGSQNLNI
jgi:hypothetical protein